MAAIDPHNSARKSASHESEIREILDAIIDPCSANAGAPAGILTMGLIRNLSVVEVGDDQIDVEIILGVTEPGCLMGWTFQNEARARIAALSAVRECTVKLDARMLWTEDDLDPTYRERLAQVRRDNR